MVRGPSVKFRLAIYPILGAFFIIACFFVVLLALGYNFKLNKEKLVLEKTGLIILATKPGDAKVYLDGELQKKKTPAFSFFTLRLEKVSLGNHTVRVEKEGYETWESSYEIESGKVCWGNYVLLVPQKRKKTYFNFPNDVTQVILSRDNTKELIKIESKSNNTVAFWEITTGTKERRKIYEARVTQGESFRLVNYSFDKEKILVERTKEKNKSWLVFEAKENPNIWDVTEAFKMNFSSITFNPRNHNELYITRENNLYSLDFLSNKMSAVLFSNVIALYPDPDTGALFVQKNENKYNLWQIDQEGEKRIIIRSLPVSDSYQIKYLKEHNSYAVLIGSTGSTKDLYLYDGDGEESALKKIAKDVNWFLPSPKSKYLGYRTQAGFFSYDPEKEKIYTTLSNKKISSISWFSDEGNLIYTEGNKIYLVNYNGYYNKYLFDANQDVPIVVGPASSNIYFGSLNSQNVLDIAVYTFDV